MENRPKNKKRIPSTILKCEGGYSPFKKKSIFFGTKILICGGNSKKKSVLELYFTGGFLRRILSRDFPSKNYMSVGILLFSPSNVFSSGSK